MLGSNRFSLPSKSAITLGISVLINLALLYRVFDVSMTLDYSLEEIRHLNTRADQGLEIVRNLTVDTPKERIESLARFLLARNMVTKVQPNIIVLGYFEFSVVDGRISSVKYLE